MLNRPANIGSKRTPKCLTKKNLLLILYVLIYWYCCWSPVDSLSSFVVCSVDDCSLYQLPATLFTLTNRNSAFFKWFLKIDVFFFTFLTCVSCVLNWLLLFPLCESMNERRSQVMHSHIKPSPYTTSSTLWWPCGYFHLIEIS